jgi:hypothetical protein
VSSPEMRRRLASVAVAVRRVRWEVRIVAARYPFLYLPVVRHRYRAGQFQIPLGADTELVIDGFLRSGTTFMFTAFEQAQPRKVRVAHHSHAPAQIIAAARRGVPSLVLIREPEEAVLSLVVRLPYLSLSQGLRSYARFYEPLRSHRAGFVVGTFHEATSNVGSLIRRVNLRFGTSFAEFEPTDENVATVMALIEHGDRREFGSGELFERAVGRPSPARDRMKDSLRDRYRARSLARLRRRAEAAYEAITRDAAPNRGRPLPGTA